MNFLEYYKPKNLWKLINDELTPRLDEHSMIYISAAENFGRVCKSMNCNDIEIFYDIYRGISLSVLTLYKIHGIEDFNVRELILYATTFGASHIDIKTYHEIISNIIKYGDKKVFANFLGCLIDIGEHLGIERTKSIVSSNQILERDKINTLKQG